MTVKVPRLTGTIAILSDTQIGGSTALMPPSFITPDGQQVIASIWQSWLWQAYQDYICQLKARKRRGAAVFVLCNGDVIEANHHNTMQIVTADETAHVALAIETLDPLMALADGCAFVRGTPAHAGEVSRWEEQIARQYTSRGLVRNDAGGFTHPIFRRSVFGVRIHAAHHIGGGNTPQGMLNAISAETVKHIYESGRRDTPHAHYLIRSHKHRWADTGATYPVRGIVTPAWQLPTQLVYAIDREASSWIGGVFIDVFDDGHTELVHVDYPVIREDRDYPEAMQNDQTATTKR